MSEQAKSSSAASCAVPLPCGEQLASNMDLPYVPLRPARSLWVPVRNWRYHLQMWGDFSQVSAERPLLVLAHGFMDVGASFQFLVDELARREGEVRCIVAPDWRGFGHSQGPDQDDYTFADYLGDLDGLIDALLAQVEASKAQPAGGTAIEQAAGLPIDLLGHSMGGNIAMTFSGVRPRRVRRLVNIEGFGLPRSSPAAAPSRLAHWLDSLKAPASLRSYASREEVAARLRQTNPRLRPDRAAWLAGQWAVEAAANWKILADPAHRRPSATPYQVEEALACWRAIQASVLWVEGDETQLSQWWGERYPRSDFESRLAQVPQVQRCRLSPSGHMVHHNLPEALAEQLLSFLGT